MKNFSATDHRSFYRKNIVDQLTVSAQADFIYMGFFDCNNSLFIDWWFGCGAKSLSDPGPEQILDIIRTIDQVVAKLKPRDAADPAVASDQEQPTGKAHWIRSNEYFIGVGDRLGNLVPVVVALGDGVRTAKTGNPALQIAMSYVTQELYNTMPRKRSANSSAIEMVLSMLSINFAVVDSYGNIDYGTNMSTEWLQECGGFEINERRLSGRTQKTQRLLHHALRLATSPVRLPSIVSIDTNEAVSKIVVVMPVEKSSPPRALVMFEDESHDPVLRDHLLKLSGLTNSERRITHHILEGKTLAETAEETNLSLSTVRSYMKGIFAKTSTHRQSELITRFQHAVPRVKYAAITGNNLARREGASRNR